MSHRVVPLSTSEIEVVYSEGLLIERWVRTFRNGEQYGVNVTHVVASDDVRTVCQPVRMFVVRRAKQQRGGIDRAAGNYDNVGGVVFCGVVARNDDARDFATRRRRFQPLNVSICQKRNVRKAQRRIDTQGLCIGLRVDK